MRLLIAIDQSGFSWEQTWLATKNLWDTISLHMERVPFFRRSLWIIVLGLILIGLPYTLLYMRAAPVELPGSLLRIVPIIGFLSAGIALILSIMVIMQVHELRDSPALLLRTLGISLWLFAHLSYLTDDPTYYTLRLILFDVDLLALALGLSLILAAQFVLPVESGRDRLLAIRRLIGYALGERGPVTFVEEGKARQAYAEDRRPGPGVFLIDNASAVVLRTDTAFTRAMGPGVVFTRPGERCAEALDLRPQIRPITGSATEIDPSEAEVTSEAVTQDGINISADLSITFMLDPGLEGNPRLGRLADKPPYEYNQDSVERAVYAHTFGEFGDVPWTQIPALVVVDVWREQVKSWPLNDLLDLNTEREAPLDQIRAALRERLLPPARRDFHKEIAEPSPDSRELEILKSRGIRILEIEISNLALPESIEEDRVLRWRETWAGEVQTAMQDSIDRIKHAQEKGESEADRKFLTDFGSDILVALRENKQPDKRETLLALISDALHSTASNDSQLLEPQLQSHLAALQNELQSLAADCQDPGAVSTA